MDSHDHICQTDTGTKASGKLTWLASKQNIYFGLLFLNVIEFKLRWVYEECPCAICVFKHRVGVCCCTGSLDTESKKATAPYLEDACPYYQLTLTQLPQPWQMEIQTHILQNLLKVAYRKNPCERGMMTHNCNFSTWEVDVRGSGVQGHANYTASWG